MTGKFMQLHTLNLDFSIHLTSLRINCFSFMPNLRHVSLCATRVTNLWTTSAALSKLPSLEELRFQSCLCCYGTGPCPKSGEGVITSAHNHFGKQHPFTYIRPPSFVSDNCIRRYLQHFNTEETTSDLSVDDSSFTCDELLQSTTEETSGEVNSEISSYRPATGDWADTSDDAIPGLDEHSSSEILVNPSEHNIFIDGRSSIKAAHQIIEEVMYSSREIRRATSEIDTLEDLINSNMNGHATLNEFSGQLDFRNCSSANIDFNESEEGSSVNVLNSNSTTGTSEFDPEKPISHHPSPICFEKYYREYMICSLPNLRVLDNFPINKVESKKAKVIFNEHYEYIPYNRHHKESVVDILQKRELGTGSVSLKSSNSKRQYSRECLQSYTRSLSAAKLCSSPWPHLHPVSKYISRPIEETYTFRPRQFEYHPCNPSLMVFGTLDGQLVVLNHESQKLVGHLPSAGAVNSILGLCWLKKFPSKLIAGSDDGSLQLYDICRMASTVTDRYCSLDASVHTFDEFEQLTSVHINSTDEYFIASGFSKHVALYDIGSGRRMQFLNDLHQEHINVVKFAHHSPAIFATASFDQDVKMWDLRQGTSQPCFTASSSRGNVMVCFSPDDQYLLSSAIDNEVKQLLAVDGRVHMKFNIASTGSSQNFTRSYYMNGRDYIISGSCEEDVVRICSAQTGRRLRDISLEGRGSDYSMFVQSLRGDPHRDFHMSVLAAYSRPTKSEIIKVNLLSSNDCISEDLCARRQHSSSGMGG